MHTFSCVQPWDKSIGIENCLEELGACKIISSSRLLAAAPQLKFTWPSLEMRDLLKEIHVSQMADNDPPGSVRLHSHCKVLQCLFVCFQRRAVTALPLAAGLIRHALVQGLLRAEPQLRLQRAFVA